MAKDTEIINLRQEAPFGGIQRSKTTVATPASDLRQSKPDASRLPRGPESRNPDGLPLEPAPTLPSGSIPERTVEGKHWPQSMTVWGTLITMLTVGLPVFGPLVGLPITPEAAKIVGDQLVQAVQAIGVVAGTGMQLYGRARATGPLQRREITLRL